MALVRDELANHLGGAGMGEIVRDGFKVALVGAPNSGKSSLLNALARRDVAIVTHIPGTTRDVLEVDLDLGGYAVRLHDTAGLRSTEDIVELEGIRRAHKAVHEADFVLMLTEIGNSIPDGMPEFSAPRLSIGTKSDVHGISLAYDLCLSIHDPQSLALLQEELLGELRRRSEGLSLALPARQRHRQLLTDTLVALDAAVSGVDEELDIRAEDMRAAAQSLGRITGRVDVEDLLRVIFSEFCIGK
jgi:tRNA modification GTPase